MVVPIEHVIGLAGSLFLIGAVGAIVRRNALVVLMCIEVMLAASVLAIVGFARVHADSDGHVLALLGIVVAGVQSAVGLAVVAAYFRGRESLDTEEARELKW